MGEYVEIWNRKKHAGGRPLKNMKTPEELEEAFIEWLEWAESNPIETFIRVQASSRGGDKGASQFRAKVARPLTLESFCLRASISDWRDFKASKKRQTKEFSQVIKDIELTCRTQQVEGAIVGRYRDNIIARLNGISEKVEAKTEVKVEKQLTPKEAAEHIKSIQESV